MLSQFDKKRALQLMSVIRIITVGQIPDFKNAYLNILKLNKVNTVAMYLTNINLIFCSTAK